MRDHHLSNNARGLPMQVDPDFARLLRSWDRAAALRVDEAAASPDGTVVRVQAVARPGPDGPLTAPMSGRPCVWYRCYQAPRAVRALQPETTASDGTLVHDTGAALRRRWQPSDEVSTRPFVVTDGGTDGVTDVVTDGGTDGGATIGIDPAAADIDTDVLSCNAVDRRWVGLYGLTAEWIVPVDARVTALGVVRRDPHDGRPGLVCGPEDWVLVTTRPEAQVRGRSAAGARPTVRELNAFVLRQGRIRLSFDRWAKRVALVAIVLFVLALVGIALFA